MNKAEQFPQKTKEAVPKDFDVSGYESETFYPVLKKLPREIAYRAMQYVEVMDMDDEQITKHLQELLENREAVQVETVISDTSLQKKIENDLESIIEQVRNQVYEGKENFLGSGMTAKVKLFTIESDSEPLNVAIKYLETPTKKTLSASAEHDMLLEVERIQKIEEIEESAGLKHLSVPHPLFHHQDSKVECYGMQFIDGHDLSFDLSQLPKNDHSEKILHSLAKLDTGEIHKEIEIFLTRMHEYCLHGDIKPANLMFDSNGKFYVIDFGQSVLVTDIPDKAQDQLYTLREDEVKIAKECVTHVIRQAQAILAAR